MDPFPVLINITIYTTTQLFLVYSDTAHSIKHVFIAMLPQTAHYSVN